MAASLVAYLTDISIRSLALAVIAAAALGVWNNRGAAVRHAVWTVVVAECCPWWRSSPAYRAFPCASLAHLPATGRAIPRDAHACGRFDAATSTPIPYTPRIARRALPLAGERSPAGYTSPSRWRSSPGF